jgi:hypothetical protein
LASAQDTGIKSGTTAGQVEGHFKEINPEKKTIRIQPDPKVVEYATYRLADDCKVLDKNFKEIDVGMIAPDSEIVLHLSENRVERIVLVQVSS